MQLLRHRVFSIHYRCDTPGPEIDEGEIVAAWTGAVDCWGKLTFMPINGGLPLYLLRREIVSVEPWGG